MKSNFRKLGFLLLCGALVAVGSWGEAAIGERGAVWLPYCEGPFSTSDEGYLTVQSLEDDESLVDDHGTVEENSEEVTLASAIKIVSGGPDVEEKTLDDSSSVVAVKSLDGYISTHNGVYHSVYAVSLFGDYITLNDGLSWYVPYDEDRAKVSNFKMESEYDPFSNTFFYRFTDNIFVLTGSYTNYALWNQTTGEKIGVNLIEPLPGQLIATYFVFDIIGNLVFLNDGSTWEISRSDTNKLQQWNIGDFVTLGLNDGFFQCFNRNILINVRSQKYIKGNCIRP